MAVIGIEMESDQLVLTRGRDFRWSFENLNDANPPQPVDFPPGDLFFELQTRGETNAVQQVLVTQAGDGTYKLGHGGQWTEPIDFNDVTDNPQDLSGDILDALVGLPSIGSRDNIKVRPSSLYPVWQIDLALARIGNEVQQIVIHGSPTGGYYWLTFGSQSTAHLAWNATAAQIQTALQALPSIGVGNVSVTGTAPTFTVTFQGALEQTNVPQLSPGFYTSIFGFGIFNFPTLTGGSNPSVSVTTTAEGTPPLSQALVNTLNTTLNTFFDAFEDLLGVSIDYTLHTSYEITFRVRSTNSFDETGLITFAVDVTSDLLVGVFNAVTSLLNLFGVIHVDFFWEHTYEVEFTGELGIQPQPALDVDITDLVGVNQLEPSVRVSVVDPGRTPLTLWHFDIDGSQAGLKIESQESDQIAERVEWQLVFIPDGEEAGGDPVGHGITRIQNKNAYIKGSA